MKYNWAHVLLLLGVFMGFSQPDYEREYRIVKSQFPENARNYLDDRLTGIRKTRFYKEADSTGVHYTARFKKDRLYYDFEFDSKGALKHIALEVQKADIPEESWDAITRYLGRHFTKYRIRAMQQQYPVSPDEKEEITLKNAMQNLILPTVNYEFIITGHNRKHKDRYDLWFDAAGNLNRKRKSLPANHDHVLY